MNRPPKKNKGPQLAMVPLVLPDGETSEQLLRYIKEYADYLDVPSEGEVHPLTKFRAWCHHSFGNAQVADVICHAIGDCGLALMAVSVGDRPPKLITS